MVPRKIAGYVEWSRNRVEGHESGVEWPNVPPELLGTDENDCLKGAGGASWPLLGEERSEARESPGTSSPARK